MLNEVGAIARAAGEFVRGMERQKSLIIREKGSSYDFVTSADTGSQQLIKERVRALFPDDLVIGEEDNLTDREVLDRCLNATRRVWLVDPVDGTANYIRGLGGYAVSIGVFEAGEVVCAAVYLPESDELFTAQKGKGAALNGAPIHVAERSRLCDAVGATHVPVSDMDLRRRCNRWNEAAIMASQNLRMLGSSVRTQMKVAAGGLDYYYEYGPHPWDVAAGSLIIREAGGVVSRLDGGAFDYALGGVLAASAAIHGEALALLNAADDRMNEFGILPA